MTGMVCWPHQANNSYREKRIIRLTAELQGRLSGTLMQGSKGAFVPVADI